MTSPGSPLPSGAATARTPVTLIRSDSDVATPLYDRLPSLLSKAGADISLQPIAATKVDTDLINAVRATGVALMGFQFGRREAGELPPIVQLRQALGVYANLRPIQSRAGIHSRFGDLDLWLVRETTEDVYAHLEHESLPGVFESLKVTTRAACERIVRTAFEVARKHGRKTVTTVHKSNIMKLSDGLFLRVSQEIAKEYPDIAHDEVIVDACCMKLVLKPQQFDVLVMGNLFGDIVADLCAGLVGGPANTPSINLGPGVAVFTVGQRGARKADVDDPVPLVLSTLYLLEHLGHTAARRRLGAAAEAVVTEDGLRTPQLGGEASCGAWLDALEARL